MLFVTVITQTIFLTAYPPLSEMVDEEKSNWKPGMKKKKSEKVDATWNPKSKYFESVKFLNVPISVKLWAQE